MKKCTFLFLTLLFSLNSFAQNLSSLLYENWDNPGWLAEDRYDYGYDANNYLTSLEYRVWDQASTSWTLAARANHTNNANGLLLQRVWEEWDGNTWGNSNKGTFSYNAAGKILLETEAVWDANTWKTVYNVINTYDNNQYLIETIDENYTITGILASKQKSTFTNNGSGIVQQVLTQYWDTTTMVWITNGRTTYTYNVNGKVTLEMTESWQNNAWQPNMKITYAYDANNYLIQSLRYYYQVANNQWVQLEQNDYINLANGKIYQNTYQYWNLNTNSWDLSGRETYTYANTAIDHPHFLTIHVSPNPSSDFLHLKLDNSQPFSGTITNIEGKQVQKLENSNATFIDIRDLPVGTYFLHLQQNHQHFTSKFIKTKR